MLRINTAHMNIDTTNDMKIEPEALENHLKRNKLPTFTSFGEKIEYM